VFWYSFRGGDAERCRCGGKKVEESGRRPERGWEAGRLPETPGAEAVGRRTVVGSNHSGKKILGRRSSQKEDLNNRI
jgi:hypothetical protein